MVGQEYFWTRGRWEEHLRGLEEEKKREAGMVVEGLTDWEKDTYLPMGTCGAVVVDSWGTICVATSTGGLTNKVPGRVGDTPSMGTGFWAEEWFEEGKKDVMMYQPETSFSSPMDKLSRGDLGSLLGDCLPSIISTPSTQPLPQLSDKPSKIRHAVGLSGTGNGDSFIRMSATRTAAALSRFSHTSLSTAANWMAGRGGELQKSAGDRWGRTGEGAGGMIGIEVVGEKANVVWDFNCGGLFRAWVDDEGEKRCLIFRSKTWEGGPEGWDEAMQ
jgi:L-asparaginase